MALPDENKLANEDLDRRLKILEEKPKESPIMEKEFVDIPKDGQRMIQELEVGTIKDIVSKATLGFLTSVDKTDLTDGGATTLHKHDHGGMDGLADDDHPQYLGISNVAMDTFTIAHEGVASWTEDIVIGFIPKVLFLYAVQAAGIYGRDISFGVATGSAENVQETVEASGDTEYERSTNIFYNNRDIGSGKYLYGKVTTWASTVIITFTADPTWKHSAKDTVLLWVALK